MRHSCRFMLLHLDHLMFTSARATLAQHFGPVDKQRICAHISAYTRVSWNVAMSSDTRSKPELSNWLALRQASRHVTQFYDQFLSIERIAHHAVLDLDRA